MLMIRERGVWCRREVEVVEEERMGEPVEGSVAAMMEEGAGEGCCGCDGGFRVGAAVSAAE